MAFTSDVIKKGLPSLTSHTWPRVCVITGCKQATCTLCWVCFACSLCTGSSTHASPSLLDSLQRGTPPPSCPPPFPIPLKVPFSLVLMADRLWPHSLSAAACPHCVPLSGSSAWVEDGRPTWTYGPRVSPLAGRHYHPPAIPGCPMHPSLREGGRGGHGGRGERERHGLRVLVALGCLFNS